MNRDETIQARTDAILASDPKLTTWERGKMVRALRMVGHALYVITLGV